VLVLCERKNGLLRIRIKDSGIGMSQEELSRLFKPFQQVDGSITRRFGGTGLGLALSQRLMAMMNGRITVASEKGRGSTFTLEMPLLEEGSE
jgi:signal transduction histidine kinase